MPRLRSSSRSHSSVSSASTLSDAPLTPPTSHPHTYRQLTLVPLMKSIKPRPARHSSRPALPLTRTPAAAATAAATHDTDSHQTAAPSPSQPTKQITLDSFLVPQSQPLTATQRRQQRRQRIQQSKHAQQRTHTAAVVVDAEDGGDGVGARRVRREVEVSERARALKEERMDSDDEEDIPLFRIAPPALHSSLAAPATPSSSSQSQSSLPSSLSSSLSSAIPSSASPVRRLKDEDEDEWDEIPAFVLQPQQLQPPPPPPPVPQQPAFLASSSQKDPSVATDGLSHRPAPPVPPPPLSAPLVAAAVAAPVNPFAQSTSVPSSGGVKAEWDDAPSVRLPLSQLLQSLSEAKAAADVALKPTTANVRVKREASSPSASKENRPPPSMAPPSTTLNSTRKRAQPSSPSSPPPLEPATQREPVAVQRASSSASELSVDSISSVEEERSVTRPSRVKRERVAAPLDDIEDEYEPQQLQRETAAVGRRRLLPPRSSLHLPSSSAAQAVSSSFTPHLAQPLPLHPYNGVSSLLASPPPFAPPHLPAPPAPPALYAGPVEDWPLAFPEAVAEVDDSKQPAAMAGGGYSFRGISALHGEAAVNYGSLFQPKQKRKRRAAEDKDEDGGRAVKSEKKKTKKKTDSASKRRKSDGGAGGKEEADETDGAAEGRGGKRKKKKAASGRWCTVNGMRCYVVGNRRLTGSAAYMAYRNETEGSSSSGSKKKGSKKKSSKAGAKKKTKKGSRKGATKVEKRSSSSKKKTGGGKTERSDSEEEWQPGTRDADDSGGDDEGDSGSESAGSLADFIVDDDFIEPASSEDD